MPMTFIVAALVMTATPKPAWIMTLPESSGRVYGLGVASASNTRALALRQAQNGAKADVVARLRANIKSDTQIKTDYREARSISGKVQTGEASRYITATSNVKVQAQAVDIPGLKVETSYLEEDPTSPTMYVLAYLDLGVATQEVQARLDSIRGPLAAELGTGLRARLHRTQVLKKALSDLVALEDLFGLIRAGGADPILGEAILGERLKVEKERADLRATLTFGMPSGADTLVDADVRGVVRTAFLQEGLGWSDQNPDLSVMLRAKDSKSGVQAGSAWWDYTRNPDFIMAQGAISLTLVDRAGQEYESTQVVAKGVGANEFQADALLVKDYKAKVPKVVATWLADLGK